jgi:hypothetical protein
MKTATSSIALLEDGALPVGRALKLFDLLADRKNLAFGYDGEEGGCDVRELHISTIFSRMHLNPKTAWAFQQRDKKLSVHLPGQQKPFSWEFHVASALPVRRAEAARAEDMVFDPTLFDGPATLQEWGQAMGAAPDSNHLVILPLEHEPVGHFDIYYNKNGMTPAKVRQRLASMEAAEGRKPRIVLASALRADEPAPSGRTWKSARAAGRAPG